MTPTQKEKYKDPVNDIFQNTVEQSRETVEKQKLNLEAKKVELETLEIEKKIEREKRKIILEKYQDYIFFVTRNFAGLGALIIGLIKMFFPEAIPMSFDVMEVLAFGVALLGGPSVINLIDKIWMNKGLNSKSNTEHNNSK